MSAHQGSYACRITVDRQTADILREESKLVLVFNHETFEDFSDFTPVGQEALANIFCDAIAKRGNIVLPLAAEVAILGNSR
jgi:hypothetical protein